MRRTRAENREVGECWVRRACFRHGLSTSAPGSCSFGRFPSLALCVLRISRWCCAPIMVAGLWYLLIPPLAGGGVNTNAPLPDWNQAGTYNSREECASAKSNITSMFLRTARSGSERTKGLMAIEQSDCVASDDFRLKAAKSSQTTGGTQALGR